MNANKVLETIAKEAEGIGIAEAYREYHGPMNDHGALFDRRRMLYNVYVGIFDIDTDDVVEHRKVWEFIDEAYLKGKKIGKKKIADENRANRRRIAKMNAEYEMKEKGFGM